MKKQTRLVKKPSIKFLDDCLLIDESILVLGDLHIGYEEHIAEEGIFPRVQLKKILEKLEGVFELLDKEKIKITKIIILGDLKHEFGGISNVEWRETLRLLDYLDKKIDKKIKRERIVLIKGNHDNILGPIARKRNVKLKNYYKIRGVCFLHGNKEWVGCLKEKILIMGHLHPAITLKDKYKREKYKCFLKGKWKRKQVYILPSFSPISFGYNLDSMKYSDNGRGFLIIDDKVISKFEVIIYNNKENKEYNFGRLKNLD